MKIYLVCITNSNKLLCRALINFKIMIHATCGTVSLIAVLGGGLARGSLSLTEAALIVKHQSQIGIHAGTRLHSCELERAAHQSFKLSLVSDAYDNPAMIPRYSASLYELKLRQIQGLGSRRSQALLLTSTRARRDHAASSRYYSFFSL